MAGNDPVDQDAIAAQWEACARFRGSRSGCGGGELQRTHRVDGPAMGRDGGGWQPRLRRRQERRRARPVAGRNRQPARLHRRRGQSRRKFRHSRDHRLGDGLLRAPADARNRVRPPGAVDDDELAQFHLRQRRSFARPHHLGPLRRLHELDPAAGGDQRFQGRGMGELRSRYRRFQSDLFDHRRAARRPPRQLGDAHRGTALHHDRDRTSSSGWSRWCSRMPSRRSGRCRR